MPKHIHIFGDSFSAGFGFEKKLGKVPRKYSKYAGCTWDEKIKLYFKDYEVVNYAVPGCSNEVSKDSLLQNINSFKKDDIVIFGLTDHYRLSVLIDENRDFKIGRYFNFTTAGYLKYLQNIEENKFLGQQHVPNYIAISMDRLGLNIEQFTSLVDYYSNFIDKEDLANQRELYYKKTLNGLISFFGKLDVKMYVWDATIRGDGENILTWSNKEYDDLHWSPNGHNFFLGFLLWSMENNHRYLDLNFLRAHRKDVDSYTKLVNLNKYVKHDPTAIPI